jgi:Dolichyl-phosphate-mannose-protein mannosyltransferase
VLKLIRMKTRSLQPSAFSLQPFSSGLQPLAFSLFFVVVLTVFVRLRLLSIPLERDEGEFAYAGQLMLEGIPPYKLAFNIKLPGTYAAYAGLMGLFGQTTAGIHFGFLLVNLATLALLFLIARQLLDSESAAIACICYVLFSLSPGVLGLVAHATHLVVLMALGGLWLLLKARASGRAWSFWWSGILFGLSFLCKQPGLFFGMFGGAILLRDAAEAPAAERAARLRQIGIFCLGVALPFLATCLWMCLAGTFQRFWFWTMVYAPYHAWNLGEEQVLWQWNDFNRRGGALELWALAAAAGLVCLIVEKARSEAKFIIVCLLGFSLMALMASFYFFRHYFIVLLPVISLLVAVAVRRAARGAGWKFAGGCFALACAAFIFVNRAVWFQLPAEAVSRSLYQREPFPEAGEIGRYLRAHSAEGDSIEVLGSEPEIYFHAHRHSVSGFLYMYDLTKHSPYAADMRKEMMRDIETAKPLFLVDVHVPTSWAITMDSDRKFVDWSSDYARQYYDLAGKVVLAADGRADYLWGAEAATREKDAWMYVSILKRKPGR